jgi:HD superfamily phosphodiesterase
MKLCEAEAFILKEFRKRLSETLYYHSVDHVLDVAEAVSRIAFAEGITDVETLSLLRTAALFHDVGFLKTYAGHEEKGCEMVHRILPDFDYADEQILIICGMIRATEIPQNPTNKLEEILCDADLDYLGRDDFEVIARYLFCELRERKMVKDEKSWNQIQVRFMKKHHYWTPTSNRTRQPKKQENLAYLQSVVDQ